MSKLSKIALVKEMLESAEASLRSAKQLLNDVAGGAGTGNARDELGRAAKQLGSDVTETGKVLEGVFDGQQMIGSDGKNYPVPANYASKSKLVVGDVMKLTITDDGTFLYKQIGPVERLRVVGPLTQEDGAYKVIANGRAYKILLASVTFYRAEPGDQVAILLPENGEAEWGAVDNVIPRLQAEMQAEEQVIDEAKKTAGEIDLGSVED